MSDKLYFWQIRKRNKYQLEGQNRTPTQPPILLQSAQSQTVPQHIVLKHQDFRVQISSCDPTH
jgi:hypothetical protein